MVARDDEQAVLAANAAFYRAFESLDQARMEAVWLRAPHVTCIHPGWSALVGWGPVMTSWARIFENTLSMRFTVADARVMVAGDLAWIVCTEEIESEHRDGRMEASVQATNVFARHDGRWLLVHHHGSSIHVPVVDPGTTQVH
jgi:ketosteroid isomerase-like protein